MIELLAVVLVLIILFALILPLTKALIGRSHAAACTNNLRQMGVAVLAYGGDHDGWLPPGYPLKTKTQIGQVNFNSILVPGYLRELPLCPLHHLTAAARQSLKKPEKQFLRERGGSYGLHGILCQFKPGTLPWPGWNNSDRYSASRMPFIVETGIGSTTWNWVHQNQVLQGVPGYGIEGRSHGKEDGVHFLFLDGHSELVSRNDTREIDEGQKLWKYPNNPTGPLADYGNGGRIINLTWLELAQ